MVVFVPVCVLHRIVFVADPQCRIGLYSQYVGQATILDRANDLWADPDGHGGDGHLGSTEEPE